MGSEPNPLVVHTLPWPAPPTFVNCADDFFAPTQLELALPAGPRSDPVAMRLVVGLGLGMLAWGCGAAVVPPKAQPQAVAPSLPAFKRGLTFGTADPYTLLGFDPEAQWVALCQAREDTDGDGITRVGFFHHGEPSGDRMKTYFVLGGGEGEAVDGYLGAAASGGWVALRKSERVYLLNTRTGAERNLAQIDLDQEADPSPAGGVRMLSFSPTKEQLLLVQDAKAGRASVALMELATGELRRVDLGAGRVWQAGFSEDGTWIRAALVTADRNGNGSLDLPTIVTTLRGDACGQPASYSTFGLRDDHDEVTSVAVPVAGGKVRPTPEVQGFLEGDLVLTRDDGSLVRENASGAQQVLAGPACEAGVLDYYSLEYQRWLVACRPASAAAPSSDPAPTFGGLPISVPRTEIWAFGQGLPKAGRATGISLAYGAEPGAFGTERYSRLVTEEGTLLFDLKELDVEPLPKGYELCARHGETYLLQPRFERDDDDEPVSGAMAALWSPGQAVTPLVAASSCTGLRGGQHALLDGWIFDWQAKKVVGSVAPLCADADCRALSYAPYAERQGFLLKRALVTSGSAASLERRLRESLGGRGPTSYAEQGPLSFQSWSPPDAAGPARPKPTRLQLIAGYLQEPSPSCEPVVFDVKSQPSALPDWTTPRALGGTMDRFPGPWGTSDEQPTYEYLQQQICPAKDLSFAFDGVEQALAAAEKRPRGEELSVDFAALPATQPLRSLLQQCSPVDTCRHAVALADSRYEKLKAKLAAELLVACDAQTVGSRFEQLQVEPLLHLEWLVAGAGRKTSGAKLKPLLERVLASKDADDIERAIMLVASDKRSEATQLLLSTRARLLQAPLLVVKEARSGQAETNFGVDQFDPLLGPSTNPRLQKLHRAACVKVNKSADNFLDRYRCEAAAPGAKPTEVDARFLDIQGPDPGVEVTTLTRLLAAPAEQACASALGGVCPALPAVRLSKGRGDIWATLYRAALASSRFPGSPLANGLLDTPLRRVDGKLQATWRVWLDGQLYELGPSGITQASLAWANEQKSPPGSDALAIRGLLAWLNGLASQRASSQRFYFAKNGVDGYLVMASQSQACSLSNAKALLLSQDPTWFDPNY